MKKLISLLVGCMLSVSLCFPALAVDTAEQKQQELNGFISEVNEQYGTYFSLTVTSDTASFEELEVLKEFIIQQAKEQKQIREQLKFLEMNSGRRAARANSGARVVKNVSTTTSSTASNGSTTLTLKFKIGAQVTYDDFGFSKVTAIFSDPVTAGLDWTQTSSAGHIFGDDECVNLSATGNYHYLRNGIRLDGYDIVISAPIYIYDIR